MSHLSHIKTSISDKKILQKTLNDLGFKYEFKFTVHEIGTDIGQTEDIIVKNNEMTKFTFSWNGKEYSLLADLDFWNLDMSYEKLLDKIMQQYSYNSIITESTKYGFTNINKETLSDGSLKLVLQRWS
uniref:hypothetical protein n=1 Tax=Catenella fusiformis TaxID=3024791 RepID=UPI0027DAA015|nr:hypothetical protein REQ04_pgp196 [Catenella fusiformis]WCH57431.1 hypothetical protein [Catenella fusiformis]